MINEENKIEQFQIDKAARQVAEYSNVEPTLIKEWIDYHLKIEQLDISGPNLLAITDTRYNSTFIFSCGMCYEDLIYCNTCSVDEFHQRRLQNKK